MGQKILGFMKSKILVIEDEASIRRVLKNILAEENEDYQVEEAKDGQEGMDKINSTDYDLVLLDIKMPKLDGMEVLEKTTETKPDIPVVMISGHGTIDTAVQAMKIGALDYIEKPPDLNRLLNTVRIALDRKKLVTENKRLKKKVSKKYEMIGESAEINAIKNIIEKVAPTEARVLITGANGTGKELVAHWIHEKSERNKGPMIEVNCAAIPPELIESELFGHVKGAFTSANKDRAGKFENAEGGTIFLDEIGDMSLSAQAKVLRVLEEKKIQRVGSEKTIDVDVRVIAATNKDLKTEIEKKKFREDLYHRIAVILIPVPDLKKRPADIPLLVEYFAQKVAKEQGAPPKTFSEGAIAYLKQQDWPGNIRELRNVIERLIILGEETIDKKDVEQYVI